MSDKQSSDNAQKGGVVGQLRKSPPDRRQGGMNPAGGASGESAGEKRGKQGNG